ncbi:hypothetical protein HYW20_04240 [Candidatus Woesearchaeota archaeon]|nr:hypothetical protein [Candidatus Woesearchaeota archaeon]
MTKCFLLTRPNYDPATSYLHYFAREAIVIAKQLKGLHVSDIEGNKVTRPNLEKSMTHENPGLVFLNGHGDKMAIWGHKDEVILDSKNINLAKDKIVYSLACDSLAGLGDIAVRQGTQAYIGYQENFMLVADPTRHASPGKDNNALPFKMACTKLIESLLTGSNAREAIEITKREYIRLIKSLGTSEDPYGDVSLVRFALAWDLEFLDMKGNPEACFAV